MIAAPTSTPRAVSAVRERPPLSIVIPALNEGATIGLLLGDLQPLLAEPRAPTEIVVVDGDSDDDTREVAARHGARVVRAERGRGTQLAAGAVASRGQWLLFLHADVRVSRFLLGIILDAIEADRRREAYWCPLRIDAPGLAYRVIEAGADARSRWLGLPYGDQGLLVSREHYAMAEGHDPVPLMEDVALDRRLRRHGRLVRLPVPITVSARRWERDGVWRRTLRNWALLARWAMGASPESLARDYR